MAPDTAERRPAGGGAPDAHWGGITTSVSRWRPAGCPCGELACPGPDCLAFRPLPEPVEWPAYDVITLGLVPHDRAGCRRCMAVGA